VGFQVYGVGHGLGAFVVEVHAIPAVQGGVDVVRGSGVLDRSRRAARPSQTPDVGPERIGSYGRRSALTISFG